MIDRRLLAVLILISAIAPFSIDTYLPVLPEVGGDLLAGPSAVGLTLTAFIYGLGAGQLVLGPLSDRVGRRRPLLVGTVVCALASVGCALAPTIEVLIGMRFVQGAAGAAGVVIARAVIADLATGRAAARLFAIAAAVQGLAPVVAPLIGGALGPALGWRGILWVLAAITTVMAVGVAAVVPETLAPRHRSAAVTHEHRSAAGGHEHRSAAVTHEHRSAAVTHEHRSAAGGHEHRSAAGGHVRGMVELLRDRAFLAPALTYAFGFAVLFAYISASPFVLQGVLGLSVGWFSISFAGSALALAASSALGAKLVTRVGPRPLISVGLGVLVAATTGLVVTTTMRLDGGPAPVVLLVLLFAVTAALGQVFGNTISMALHAAGGRFGAGSALLGALQFGIGGLAGPLVGVAGEFSAVPMALTMAGAALLAVAAHRWGRSTPSGTR